MLANRVSSWARLRAISRQPQYARRPYSNPVEPTKPRIDTSSTSPATSSSTSAGTSDAAQQTASRFSRLHDRLPRFLQKYTAALRSAPVSHITSFLILHEITAIIPVVGLGWYFYRAEKLPWFAQGAWFDDGVQKFGRYFRKKGWLGTKDNERLDEIEAERAKGRAADTEKSQGNADGASKNTWWKKLYGKDTGETRRERWWGRGENGVRLVTATAAAYTLTKAILPLRLILSVWMTPLFARTTVVPITRAIKNFFTRRK